MLFLKCQTAMAAVTQVEGPSSVLHIPAPLYQSNSCHLFFLKPHSGGKKQKQNQKKQHTQMMKKTKQMMKRTVLFNEHWTVCAEFSNLVDEADWTSPPTQTRCITFMYSSVTDNTVQLN